MLDPILTYVEKCLDALRKSDDIPILNSEKLNRKDFKYDFLIPIKYNFKKPIVGKGSCIFIHLTKNYQPTAGCVALREKDFLIMLKLVKKNSKIKIF